jgi:protein-arginine kinase activator protein McsA
MACEFCGEKNKSRLGMRTRVVNGKVETVEICSSCLWERLMYDENEDDRRYIRKNKNSRVQGY